MSSRSDRQRGFTLIELLVVVAVIAIVAAISVISYFTALDKSKQRATMADMRTVSRALEAYMVDHNYAVATRHYSYAVLRRWLKTLLVNFFGMGVA